MFGQLLCRCTISVNIPFLPFWKNASDCNDLWSSIGQSSCLVECDLLNRGQTLQCISLSYKKTMLCGISNCRHDRGRCRQDQRAWTKNNKDRYRTNDLSGDQPGQSRCCQGDHYDPCCPAVCKTNDFGFSRICGLYETDHSLDRAVLSNLGCFHLKSSKLVHRSRRNLLSHSLVDRKRFSCHDCLVYRSLS